MESQWRTTLKLKVDSVKIKPKSFYYNLFYYETFFSQNKDRRNWEKYWSENKTTQENK